MITQSLYWLFQNPERIENILKELFGFGKKNKITRKDVSEMRRLLESKWR